MKKFKEILSKIWKILLFLLIIWWVFFFRVFYKISDLQNLDIWHF